MQRGVCALASLLLFSSARVDGARLVAQNRSLFLDGASEPFTLRAVLYSPTPWGYDDDLHYHTAVYESDYEAIFARDLDLIVSLGANAVRIHGFLGVADQVRASAPKLSLIHI